MVQTRSQPYEKIQSCRDHDDSITQSKIIAQSSNFLKAKISFIGMTPTSFMATKQIVNSIQKKINLSAPFDIPGNNLKLI